MKLWQKESITNKEIERFTIGQDNELDLVLAKFDVLGSAAHIRMLSEIGLLKKEELSTLLIGLNVIYQEIQNQGFTIEDGVEDIHSQVELMLTERLGDVGKKIHTGRSRNDQVLVDLRLYFRAEIKEIALLVFGLFSELQTLSELHKDTLMPGYTHFQVAMVSSFGLWFGAYAESLVDDMVQLETSYRIINQNPLGSAAGYGSSFPLNRTMTTELLGFENLAYNSIHAQMGRGKSELFMSFGIVAVAQTVSKLAMDICLFLSQNYAFIYFPVNITTGSSIMPHKKNPDIFELIRGRCNQLLSLPQQVLNIQANLPVGYHRDFQQLKEVLFPAITTLKSCLKMAVSVLPEIKVNEAILKDKKYNYLYSVEAINKEVNQGLPFRAAYHKIADQIESGDFKAPEKIQHTHEGSIHNLCNNQIKEKMDAVMQQFEFEKVEQKMKKLIG